MRELLGETFNLNWLIGSFAWSVLVAICTSIYQRYVSQKMLSWKPRIASVGIMALTIFIALAAIRFTVTNRNDVDLRPRLDFYDIGDANESSTESTPATPSILLGLTIRNAGAPTIVEGWQLEMIDLRGKKINLHPLVFHGILTIHSEKLKNASFNDNSELVFYKGILNGGAMIQGIVPFLMPEGVTRQDLMAMKKITLTFNDVLGNPHKVPIEWNLSGS